MDKKESSAPIVQQPTNTNTNAGDNPQPNIFIQIPTITIQSSSSTSIADSSFLPHNSSDTSNLTPHLIPSQPVAGVPVGLELLIPFGYLVVKHHDKFLDLMTNATYASIAHLGNSYDVINGKGERMYNVDEITSRCGGVLRPFTISLHDFLGREVLILERPFDLLLYFTTLPFGCCLCGTLGGNMNVNLPDGTKLGTIVHKINCCEVRYQINDAAGEKLMIIDGPICGDCCLCTEGQLEGEHTDYPITVKDGVGIGRIRKISTGAGSIANFGGADNFSAEFPPELDVKLKALILAFVFLLDVMYYHSSERPGDQYHYP